MPDPRIVGWVALGGAIGAVLRYGVGVLTHGTSWPYGTLIVNTLGTFVLAFLLFHDLHSGMLAPGMRAFLGIGILGAFTTMSTFGYETLVLYTEDGAGPAALNVGLNILLALAAAVAGRAVALAVVKPTV